MRNGFSYIETIIAMLLLSIASLSVTNGMSVAIKNGRFARENYFADIAVENILNMAEANLINKNTLQGMAEDVNSDEYKSVFYTDKFNFTVAVKHINEQGQIGYDNEFEINYGQEEFLPVDVKISSDNQYVFTDISGENKNDYLLVVDLFDKSHEHKKRMIKIIHF